MPKEQLAKALISGEIPVHCHFAGAISFERSLAIQEELKGLSRSQISFLGFQSETPVISQGLRSSKEDLLWSEEEMDKAGLSLWNVKRGGEATLHAPGQLVIYPILYLPFIGFKVRDFIKALESITQDFLKDLGLFSHQEGREAGLYTKRGKICFFGIHISQGVSQQGLSINVDNDLKLFSAIRSCGRENQEHDKLSLYPDISLSLEDLFYKWSDKAFLFFSQFRKLKRLS